MYRVPFTATHYSSTPGAHPETLPAAHSHPPPMCHHMRATAADSSGANFALAHFDPVPSTWAPPPAWVGTPSLCSAPAHLPLYSVPSHCSLTAVPYRAALLPPPHFSLSDTSAEQHSAPATASTGPIHDILRDAHTSYHHHAAAPRLPCAPVSPVVCWEPQSGAAAADVQLWLDKWSEQRQLHTRAAARCRKRRRRFCSLGSTQDQSSGSASSSRSRTSTTTTSTTTATAATSTTTAAINTTTATAATNTTTATAATNTTTATAATNTTTTTMATAAATTAAVVARSVRRRRQCHVTSRLRRRQRSRHVLSTSAAIGAWQQTHAANSSNNNSRSGSRGSGGSQQEASRSANETLLKQSSARLQQLQQCAQLLESLSKLRAIRVMKAGQKAGGGGQDGAEAAAASSTFSNSCQKQLQLLAARQLLYEQEKRELEEKRCGELGEEGPHPHSSSSSELRNTSQQQQQQQEEDVAELQSRAWRVLFGDKMPPGLCPPGCGALHRVQWQASVHELVAIRSQWDRYLTGATNVLGSAIPACWVVPTAPADPVWAQYLVSASSVPASSRRQ